MDTDGQGELFGDSRGGDQTGMRIIAAVYAGSGIDLAALPLNTRRLFALSADAFDAVVHAWMSELPIAAEIMRFERKILAAADTAANAADAAASDRGDGDVRIVLDAAYKAWHETHRIMGFLRFCPGKDGMYIARCEPDHFILPALAAHFTERFGQTPWAIIDEKRRLCLRCLAGGPAALFPINETNNHHGSSPDGEWGDLWRHYHKTINNESRNNPALQRQFMPRRYWKYLNELQSHDGSAAK